MTIKQQHNPESFRAENVEREYLNSAPWKTAIIPRWADKELLGFYCCGGTERERALVECIAIRESIGRQLGGYHCVNVWLILYRNHDWERYYTAERWEGIKRLLVKYSGRLEKLCRPSTDLFAWM